MMISSHEATKARREAIAKIGERIQERCHRAMDIVGHYDPPSWHWFESDACESYCWECIVKEREKQFGLGPVLFKNWWERRHTDLETAFWEEIGGSAYGIESDSCETCVQCGILLNYTLTDEGSSAEIYNFSECEISQLSPELLHEFYTAMLNFWSDWPRWRIVAAARVSKKIESMALSAFVPSCESKL